MPMRSQHTPEVSTTAHPRSAISRFASANPASRKGRTEDDKVEIRNELERVLRSKTFSKAFQLRCLLDRIVNSWLAGDIDHLDGYNLALSVLSRDESFDSGIDPIVRVYAARLRRLLDRYYVSEGAESPFRIVIPKGSYVPILANRVRHGKPQDTPCESTVDSLVVLPFVTEDCVDGPDRHFLSITDHLIRLLTHVRGIRVASRLSSSTLDPKLDARLIGKQFGARFIIECTLHRDETESYLIVHLSETQEGYNLWSKYYLLTTKRVIDLAAQIVRDLLPEIQAAARSHGTAVSDNPN